MSWLRHFRGQAIPQVLGLNNLTNAKDKRLTAIHNEKEVFVFRIQHTKLKDSGKYECQVAQDPDARHAAKSQGKKESKRGSRPSQPLFRVITLQVVEPSTQILGDADIFVDEGSTLNVTCVVSTRNKAPDFIFWTNQGKIVLFEGSEGSERSVLLRDASGRFLSRLVIANMTEKQAGVYTCQPASAPQVNVSVHVLKHAVMAVSDGDETGDAQDHARSVDLNFGSGSFTAGSSSSAPSSPSSRNSERSTKRRKKKKRRRDRHRNNSIPPDEKGEFSLSTPSSAVAPVAASSIGNDVVARGGRGSKSLLILSLLSSTMTASALTSSSLPSRHCDLWRLWTTGFFLQTILIAAVTTSSVHPANNFYYNVFLFPTNRQTFVLED